MRGGGMVKKCVAVAWLRKCVAVAWLRRCAVAAWQEKVIGSKLHGRIQS